MDRYSGYRYYSPEQLPRLNRILALRDLGFSLTQIEQLLRENQDVDELRILMELRQVELAHEVEAQQERLNRVTARLRQIEQEGRAPAYEVVLKQTPAEKSTMRARFRMG